MSNSVIQFESADGLPGLAPKLPQKAMFAQLGQQVRCKPSLLAAMCNAVESHAAQLKAATDRGGFHLPLHPSHALFVGPGGCGKRTIALELARLSGLPYAHVHLAEHLPFGPAAKPPETMVQRLFRSTTNNGEVNGGLIIVEGIQTCLIRAEGDDGKTRYLQQALAALLKGRPLDVEYRGRTVSVDSSSILFIGLMEDSLLWHQHHGLGFSMTPPPAAPLRSGLLRLGLDPALIEAFSIHLEFNPLTRADLRAICDLPTSPAAAVQKAFLAQFGVQLEFTPDAIEWILDTVEQDRPDRGSEGLVRGLRAVLSRLIQCVSSLPAGVNGIVVGAGGALEFKYGPPAPIARSPARNDANDGTHPHFPPGTLPNRPARSRSSAAGGLGRLVKMADLKRWLP